MLIHQKKYPPLPLHEQIRQPVPMPAWWHSLDGVEVHLDEEDREEERRSTFRIIAYGRETFYTRAPKTNKKVRIGNRMRILMKYFEDHKERWITFRELARGAITATDLTRILTSLTENGFIERTKDLDPPPDLRKFHGFKYRFLQTMHIYE